MLAHGRRPEHTMQGATKAGRTIPVRTSIHASVWGPHWDSARIDSTLESAARLGYDHVVIPLRSIAALDAPALARAFERQGLVPLNTAGVPRDCDIGSSDPVERARGIAHLRAALGVARDMGSPQVNGVLYGPLYRAAGPVPAESLERAADALAVVARHARDMGLRLALEVVNRYETNMLNTASQAIEFLDRIGQDNVGLHLDTFHMSIEERNPRQALQSALPRLLYFELDQSHRGDLEDGSLDLAAWVRHAVHAGYRGIVGVEAFSRSRMATDHADALAIWRDSYESAEKLAASAIAVIRRGFALSQEGR